MSVSEKKRIQPKPIARKAKTRRPIIFAMRGSRAWRGWLKALAKRENRGVTSVVEVALLDRAIKIGYLVDMPPRNEGPIEEDLRC